jgi:O-succinylbenzoic acid--CoA ligase
MPNIRYKNKIFSRDECLKRSVEVKCNYFRSVAELIDVWLHNKQEFVLHTSGTTGKPKPVVFSREQCIGSAKQTIQYFGLKKGDVFLCCLDISYVAGFMMIIRTLVAEADIYLTKAERNPLLKTDPKAKFDFAAFVPYQLKSILEETPENISKLDSMKAIIIGGGDISGSDQILFSKIKAPLYHTYGMTETLTHVALKRINGEKPDVNFKALPGVSFSKDERDCLVIKTPIIKGKIFTKDMVNLISETEFEYLGRIDHVINSGGFKIHPHLVEQKIESLIKVLFNCGNYFIFAEEDPKFGQHPVLMIEAAPDQSKVIKLNEELQKILHPYEVPKKILFREKFVMTRTGKVDRKKTNQSVSR